MPSLDGAAGATGGRSRRRDRAAAARAARRERWEALFAPWAAACAGAAISIAFLFQRDLSVRGIMFILFFGAARAAGKKVSIPATALVSAGIVTANLLVPVGRLLFRLGPLEVTETALIDGMGKALVFEGLICISKASILPGLRLPGRFGDLVAKAFLHYDRIVEYKGRVRAATLIEDVDALMLSMSEEAAPEAEAEAEEAVSARMAKGAMKPAAAAALVAAVAAAYAPLLLKL